MPYGQLVYNLRDYSGENASVSSESLQNLKLSNINNLVEKGKGSKWSKVTIQAPPFSRWLVKQATGNKLDKIIRIGKSGVFEFDQEAAVEFLSYIPTYEHKLNTNKTSEILNKSLYGFQIIEENRKIRNYWKEEREAKDLWYSDDFVQIQTNKDVGWNSEDKTTLWDWIKENHHKAPEILQFDKEITITEGKLEKAPTADISEWLGNPNITFTFSLPQVSNLNTLFSSKENTIRQKYDTYLQENQDYQLSFMEYYSQYLIAQRGIYYTPEDSINGKFYLTEIEPFNVIIDYYYDN